MNWKQKVIISAGAMLIIAIGLFPTATVDSGGIYLTNVSVITDMDISLTLIRLGIAVLATFGLVLLLRTEK